MSIIRAIKHRLGLSVTPANNFVLDASADNGTMKLARESGQDIMTVDAQGKVNFPQNSQTWQNVTASRSVATNYVNNTGQPITVLIQRTSNTGIGIGCDISVNGVQLAGYYLQPLVGLVQRRSEQLVVPAGATYRVDVIDPGAVFNWFELRN